MLDGCEWMSHASAALLPGKLFPILIRRDLAWGIKLVGLGAVAQSRNELNNALLNSLRITVFGNKFAL